MSNAKPTSSGQCRCGQVRFEVSADPLMTMACHCRGCQRLTSSAFSLSTLYPSDAFTVTQGQPAIGALHGSTRHFFCPYCMSWLFTRPEGMDQFVSVRSTLMDDAQSFSPFIETCTREKLAWANTPARHHFEQFPAPEDYAPLLAEFAKQ